MRMFVLLSYLFLAWTAEAKAQVPKPEQDDNNRTLQFAVYLSRHGVRSPTGKTTQYNAYSAAAWPAWDVPPGHLTAHGARLMELFGAYDRLQLANDGLLHATGCDDATAVTIYTDSDQRTRETGKALARGLLPGCNVKVQFLPEGTNDSLFHFIPKQQNPADQRRAQAALAGRIGGDAANLTTAFHSQIAAMDAVLAGCGRRDPNTKRTTLFDVPATLTLGGGDHLAEYKGPLSVASTMSENLLLEYTEGMPNESVGWGCVDGARIRDLIDLHTVNVEYAQRTPYIARAQASNLLDHIGRALEQSASGKEIAGAIAKPADRVLFLVGHDTNMESVAALLHLDWIMDGRRDDTPPGSILVFELWKQRSSERYEVRTYFTAQTLEQMRNAVVLGPEAPPVRTSLFVPACSDASGICTLEDFMGEVRRVTDSRFIEH